jgi:hypothetical protein
MIPGLDDWLKQSREYIGVEVTSESFHDPKELR